jgi:CheB methylesterase
MASCFSRIWRGRGSPRGQPGVRGIAVVLSGEGQDAATGATAVHRFGGTVIVSSPETSARTAMPNATMIRDNITDHVIPLDDLAGLLLALTTAPTIDPGREFSRLACITGCRPPDLR